MTTNTFTIMTDTLQLEHKYNVIQQDGVTLFLIGNQVYGYSADDEDGDGFTFYYAIPGVWEPAPNVFELPPEELAFQLRCLYGISI